MGGAWQRGVRVLLAAFFFLVDPGAGQARDLWTQRRKAVRFLHSAAFSRTDPLSASFPSVRPGLIPVDASGLPDWLANSVGLFADVRAYVPPAPGQRRVLVHVQDLHDVEEAQRNIADLLEQLAASVDTSDGLLVGVEGAAGPFRTADFRVLAGSSVIRRVSDRFLRAGLLSGPEFFSLTTDRPFRLWGVEDPFAYESNIGALTQTFSSQHQDLARLSLARRRVDRLKKAFYPPALLVLDEAKTAYETGRLPLSGFVEQLSDEHSVQEMGPSLVRYRDALRLESDWSLVGGTADQQRLLDRLAPLLTNTERRRLTETGLACRLGRAPHSSFFVVLKEICRIHRIDLAGYPHVLAHSASIEKIEGLNPEELLREVDRFADLQMKTRMGTPAAAKIFDLDQDLRMVEKVGTFAWTPDDFARWNRRRHELALWSQRGARLEKSFAGLPRALSAQPWPHIADVANRYVPFYRWAQARNRPLVQNLLARWTDDHPAVLVAGGFHADGLRSVAQSAGLGYIALVPRVIHTQKFSPPLASFRSGSKNRNWFLPGSHLLQNRLQTAGVEYGPVSQDRAEFPLVFQAAVYAELVGTSSFPSALQKLQEVAHARFGVFLTVEDNDENSGETVLTARLGPSSRGPVYTVTLRRTSPEGNGTVDYTVQVTAVSGWRHVVERMRRADEEFSTIGPTIKLWIAGTLPRMGNRFAMAFRRSAVYLIPTVRTAGGSGLLSYLGGLKSRWTDMILLAREREEVARALPHPRDERHRLLAALAQNHTLELPDPWIQSLLSIVNGTSLPSNNKKSLSIRLTPTGENPPVVVTFHVARARALYERPADHSPYQIVKNSDGQVDVYLAEPVISSPDRLLPLVGRRLLREINGETSLASPVEEAAIALGMWEYLVQDRVNSWASFVSGLKLKPEIGVPTSADQDAWVSGQSLVFSEPSDGLDLNSGLLVLIGAPPNATTESLANLDRVDLLTQRLRALGMDESAAIKHAERIVLQRLRQRLHLIEQFQKMADQRGLLTRLSWRVDGGALAQSGADLVMGLLKQVGTSQGQRAALKNIAYPNALQAQMTDQFPWLARTLVGLMKMTGQPLDRASPHDQHARLSDMWAVYAEHFAVGYGQLSAAESNPTMLAGAGPLHEVAAGVFDLRNLDDQPSFDRMRETLLRRDLNRFRATVLWPTQESEEAVVSKLMDRFRFRTPVAEGEKARVRQFLESDRVLVVPQGRATVSLDAVFETISRKWDSVTHVDVYTANVAAFDTNVSTLLSWSLFENGVLISKSVESALAEQRIRAFIQRQA